MGELFVRSRSYDNQLKSAAISVEQSVESFQSDEDWQTRIYQALNAFSPGAPIEGLERMAGRVTQIKKMLEVVAQRGQHAILYGERGVGKSSLANALAAHLRNSICVHVNCHPCDDFSAVWRKVFRRLDDSGELLRRYPNRIDPDDVVVELSTGRRPPIIILDEFDKLTTDHVRSLIANTIKNLSDRSVAATVLIVGVADSVNDLIEEHASILRCLRQISMERMNLAELAEIIEKTCHQLGMAISPDALFRIVSISAGLPHYTHLLGQQAARAALEAHTFSIAVEHIDKAVTECVAETAEIIKLQHRKAIRGGRKTSIFEQVILAAALAATDSGGCFAPADLRRPLAELLGQDEASLSRYGYHLKLLCEDDYGRIFVRIGSKRKYRYRFIEPMMQPFVLMQALCDGVANWRQISTLGSGYWGLRFDKT